jgi:hypothetical protein
VTDDPESANEHVIDVIADELGLARAQLDAGLPGLAEGTVRRRLALIEADGGDGGDEVDALHLLMAETLWRQQRPMAARAALESIRPGSSQRRLPIAMLIDAETLAAAGESDRAAGAQERLLAAVGPDEAHALRAGVPGRLSWPVPTELAGELPPQVRPPWTSATPADHTAAAEPEPSGHERVATARARMEEARVAYVAGDRGRGDGQMSIALRLDPALAPDGVRIIESTLGRQPAADRLVLYGDLLRAAGRESDAQRAYARAAERRR